MNKDLIKYGIIGSALFYAYFGRCPKRTPDSGSGLSSPCDGIIVGMEGQTILIELSIFDVHCQRAPCDGVIVDNSNINTISIQDGDGGISTTVLLQGTVGRSYRISIKVRPGQNILQGETMGQIWLGSHVRFTVPEGYKFTKHLGDVVYGGQTIIAVSR